MKRLFNRKILLGMVCGLGLSTAAGAASIEQADTLYYWGLECENIGYTPYYANQPYSVAEVYSQYKYMLGVSDIGSLSIFQTGNSSRRTPSASDLEQTRHARIRDGLINGYLTCKK